MKTTRTQTSVPTSMVNISYMYITCFVIFVKSIKFENVNNLALSFCLFDRSWFDSYECLLLVYCKHTIHRPG